tara:strand:+ start:49 stop:552 length:504 start_codon:yes stop_codon:yes gene_type:complete
MILVKNINPGLTPTAFGGGANDNSITLHGYEQAEMPVVFGSDLLPNKQGNNFLQVSPFFNQITYNESQNTDLPCKGVREVYAGMHANLYNQVKQVSVGNQRGGVSAVPQPLPNMRGNYIGLAHDQLDIEGQGMRLLPSVNSFDITKKNTISDNFYNPLIIPKRLMSK